MSEENETKRQRAPINAVRLLNQLREAKGLPRVSTKPKTVRITADLKREITQEEVLRLFPEALSQHDYEFNEEQAKRLVKEVENRITKLRGHKETPRVDGAPSRPRGRPRKA